MKLTFLLIVVIMLLDGCSTSNVVPVGRDSYAVSVTRCGICEPPRIAAYQLANEFCTKQGKFSVPRNVDSSGIVGGPTTANLTFTCVNADDPEYQRVNMRPDNGVTTIERR